MLLLIIDRKREREKERKKKTVIIDNNVGNDILTVETEFESISMVKSD